MCQNLANLNLFTILLILILISRGHRWGRGYAYVSTGTKKFWSPDKRIKLRHGEQEEVWWSGTGRPVCAANHPGRTNNSLAIASHPKHPSTYMGTGEAPMPGRGASCDCPWKALYFPTLFVAMLAVLTNQVKGLNYTYWAYIPNPPLMRETGFLDRCDCTYIY